MVKKQYLYPKSGEPPRSTRDSLSPGLTLYDRNGDFKRRAGNALLAYYCRKQEDHLKIDSSHMVSNDRL